MHASTITRAYHFDGKDVGSKLVLSEMVMYDS